MAAQRSIRVPLGVAVLAIAAANLAALAGPDPKPVDSAWFEKQITDLDSPALSTREAACKELAENSSLDLRTLQVRLTDTARPLSAEQRMRLSDVGMRLFANAPHAAMGVSFGRLDRADGVEITGTIDGFDSRRLLRPGDLIKELDGVPIASNDDARAVIISHDPGDDLAVTLVRAGETLNLRMRLGNYRELRNSAEIDPDTLRLAWELRCRRAAGQPPAPDADAIDPQVSEQRWEELTMDAARTRAQRRPVVNRRPVGLQMQPPTEDDEEGTIALVAGGAGRVLGSEPPLDFFANEHLNRTLEQVQAQNLQRQIENLNTTIRLYELRLKDARTPDAVKAAYRRQVQDLRRDVARFREQRRELLNHP